MKNITSIILILLSFGIFFGYTRAEYDKAMKQKESLSSYDDALDTAQSLKNKLTDLQGKVDAFNPDDLEKLNKLLPDNADNVRLLIDISNIGKEYGVNLKNINIGSSKKSDGDTSNKVAPYETITISFSVVSSYENFKILLRALEQSLRVVDITKLDISSSDNANSYNFNITLKTYWLKS